MTKEVIKLNTNQQIMQKLNALRGNPRYACIKGYLKMAIQSILRGKNGLAGWQLAVCLTNFDAHEEFKEVNIDREILFSSLYDCATSLINIPNPA